jgi:hypothetical protein
MSGSNFFTIRLCSTYITIDISIFRMNTIPKAVLESKVI